MCVCVCVCDTGHDAKILLPATHGQKYLRSNGTRESRSSTATGHCHTAGARFHVPPSGPSSALVWPLSTFLPTHKCTHTTQAQKTLCCQWLHSSFPRPRGEEQVWRCPCPELIACLGTCPLLMATCPHSKY